MLFLLGWLVSIAIFGTLGGWLAREARLPPALGVVIGAVCNFVGCVFLAGIWLAETIVDQFGTDEANRK